jgi:hypothetical protein
MPTKKECSKHGKTLKTARTKYKKSEAGSGLASCKPKRAKRKTKK